MAGRDIRLVSRLVVTPLTYLIGVSTSICATSGIYMLFFSPNPIPDRCHSQQPASYHTVLVGLSFPLLQIPPEE